MNAGISPKIFLQKMSANYADEICHLNWDPDRSWTLLFAVILGAQCTDARVNQVTESLFRDFPDLENFAVRPIEDIEMAIRPTGFFHSKAKYLQQTAQILLTSHDGRVPDSMRELVALPGVGRKTANVVLWNVFGKNVGFVVDTHVSRIAQRTGLSSHSTPEKIEKDLMAALPQKIWGQTSHQLVQFGRDTCSAPTPKCSKCFFQTICPKIGVRKSK